MAGFSRAALVAGLAVLGIQPAADLERLYAARQWIAALPTSAAARAEKDDVDKFRDRPDQVNGPRRRSTLRHADRDISIAASVNGQPSRFLLDTGAWLSVLSEREARKMGLAIEAANGTLGGASGQPVGFSTAVAREVTVGAMRFRDVSFAVMTEGPLRDVEGGILGMPILLAEGNLVWSSDGTLELGGDVEPAARVEPNLVFDRNHLVLKADALGRTVLTTLDTGSGTTDLNANFAATFPDVVRDTGTRGTLPITGAGGTQTFDSVRLPEVVFSIGPARVPLRPVDVTLQRIRGLGGECCVGNVGRDLLTQGREFSIDFSTMVLQVR